MIADMMAAYGGRLLIAVSGVGLGLICLIAVLKFMRHRNGPSPFVRGGKARQPRLQVLDAAAVDARRRLVLVRRDNVEHLIMIGGPSDLVIESGIAAAPVPGRAPAQPAAAREEPARLAAPEVPPPVAEAPVPVAGRRPPLPEPARRPQQPLAQPLPVTPQAAYQEESASEPSRPASPGTPERDAPAATARSEAPRAAATRDPSADQLKEAAETLETMRRRILPPGTQPAALPPRASAEPGGFGRVLQEEMKTPLPDAPQAVPPAVQRQPQRPAEPAPAPARTRGQEKEDPKLQQEIARIFGETP